MPKSLGPSGHHEKPRGFSANYITSLDEVPQHFFSVLKNYFEQYKVLENKEVKINDFQDKERAFEIINESIEFYKETFPK